MNYIQTKTIKIYLKYFRLQQYSKMTHFSHLQLIKVRGLEMMYNVGPDYHSKENLPHILMSPGLLLL